MTPEMNPGICARLNAAVEQIAADSEQAVTVNWDAFAGKQDRGHVPARLAARLHGLIKRHGFTMIRSDLDEQSTARGGKCLGATAGDWPLLPPEQRLKVMIAKGMSAASEIRVMAHECAHVVLGHVGLTPSQAILAMASRLAMINAGRDEDPDEEAAAELAAGAFCQVAGIGTGKFSPNFIWQKTHGAPVSPEAIAAGKLGARILYAAARPALERSAA